MTDLCPHCRQPMSNAPKRVTMREVLQAAVRVGGREWMTRSRRWPMPQMRFAVAKVCRDLTGASYTRIGMVMGLDHATIMRNCRIADPALVEWLTEEVFGRLHWGDEPIECIAARDIHKPVNIGSLLLIRGMTASEHGSSRPRGESSLSLVKVSSDLRGSRPVPVDPKPRCIVVNAGLERRGPT